MLDYLRQKRRPLSIASNSPTHPHRDEPYRDNPHPNQSSEFIITIDSTLLLPIDNGAAPPAYEDICMQQRQSDEAENEFDMFVRALDYEGGPAEDICKWILAMLLVSLCVLAVALGFNWGNL